MAGVRVRPDSVFLARIEVGKESKPERGTLIRLRFHPNAAAVTLDDFAAYGKTDARARILIAWMEALEYLEDFL